MMSGKLAHLIKVQRSTETVNAAGTRQKTWADLATLRAEVISRSTSEALRAPGQTDETAIVFRTRFMPGITMDDRVTWKGDPFEITEILTEGRDRGLELRCRRTG